MRVDVFVKTFFYRATELKTSFGHSPRMCLLCFAIPRKFPRCFFLVFGDICILRQSFVKEVSPVSSGISPVFVFCWLFLSDPWRSACVLVRR